MSNKPLFSGNIMRDTSVSVLERVSDASLALFTALKNKIRKTKKAK